MHRHHFYLISSLLLSSPVAAQGVFGGVAVEYTGGRPVPCIDVDLLDTDGRIVSHTRTLRDGVFQFDAPPAGAYRLRFRAFGLRPLSLPVRVTESASTEAVSYRLVLELADSLIGRRTVEGDSLPRLDPARPRQRPRAVGLPAGDGTYRATVGFVVDEEGFSDSASMFFVHVTHPAMVPFARQSLSGRQYLPALEAGRPVCRFYVTTLTVTRRQG